MKVKLREKYMAFKFRMKGIKPNPFAVAKELEKSQYFDRDQIEMNQVQSINELFSEARKNVDYYQGLNYKNIDQINSLTEFKEDFPTLKKEEIKLNSNQLLNEQAETSFVHETSGSTGLPMLYKISRKAESYRFANNIRFLKWWKLSLFDRHALIWKVKKKDKKTLGSFLKDLETRLLGRLLLNVFELNDSSIVNYVDQLNKFKPKFIRGYKSGVHELARLMDKHDLSFEGFELKLAIVTAETLEDFEREYIERILKCKVANEYGSAEAGLFSLECPEGSMHINEESVHVYTDEQNFSYVTELFNNAMPLLNYKNEDRVTLSGAPCACGRSLKVIDSIQGRITDFIACPGGQRVHSFVLNATVAQVNEFRPDSIAKFRVTQKGSNILIEIIPGSGFDQTVKRELESRVAHKLLGEMKIDVKTVDNIPREKSGKLRAFRRIA